MEENGITYSQQNLDDYFEAFIQQSFDVYTPIKYKQTLDSIPPTVCKQVVILYVSETKSETNPELNIQLQSFLQQKNVVLLFTPFQNVFKILNSLEISNKTILLLSSGMEVLSNGVDKMFHMLNTEPELKYVNSYFKDDFKWYSYGHEYGFLNLYYNYTPPFMMVKVEDGNIPVFKHEDFKVNIWEYSISLANQGKYGYTMSECLVKCPGNMFPEGNRMHSLITKIRKKYPKVYTNPLEYPFVDRQYSNGEIITDKYKNCEYEPDYRHYGLTRRDFVLQMLENIKPPFSHPTNKKHQNNNFTNKRDMNETIHDKIFITLPTFNRGEKCVQVIQNIMDQKYAYWKLYIIDDGSEKIHGDEIKQFLEKCGKKYDIEYFRNDTNLKLPKTLNVSIHQFLKSDCEYFTWVSDDNEYYHNFLEDLHCEISKENVDLVYSGWDENIEGTSEIRYKNPTYNCFEDVLNKWDGMASFMWTKQMISQIGEYNLELNSCEDYDYILRTFLWLDKASRVNTSTMKYTVNSEGSTSLNTELCEQVKYSIKEFYHNVFSSKIELSNFVKCIVYFKEEDLTLHKNQLNIFLTDRDDFEISENVWKIPKSFQNFIYTLFKIKPKENCLKYEKNIGKNMVVSIVMAYYNRKPQTLNTLDGFEEMYAGKYNFEVIIVDDNSNDENKLEEDIKKYSFPIKIITNNIINVSPIFFYNEALSKSLGKIIMLQDSSCFHVKNIIDMANEFYEQDFCKYEINNKSICIIHKSKIDLIKLDERFNTYRYCIKAFMLAVQYNLRLNNKCLDGIVESDDTNNIESLNDKKLYENIKQIHERNDFVYPKLLFLYWDGSPLSYLNYLTVESFNEYNPEWKIVVYVPKIKSQKVTWKTGEQIVKYNGECYFSKLYKQTNVIVREICLNNIGFDSSVSEVIKSDYFRYYILEKHGGIWSDFDIVYNSSIEDNMNFKEESVIFRCKTYNLEHIQEHEFIPDKHNNKYCSCGHLKEFHNGKIKDIPLHFSMYYPIGLFMTKPKSEFFVYINKNILSFYDKTNYQCLGASMFLKLFPHSKDKCDCGALWCYSHPQYFKNIESLDIFKSLKICNENYYLPICWNKISIFFEKNIIKLPENNIGVHWFNGSSIVKKYINKLDNRITNFQVECYMDKIIHKYMYKKEKYDIIIYYSGQYKKLQKFIYNISNIYNEYLINLHIVTNNHLKFNKKIYHNVVIYNYENLNDSITNIHNNLIFFQDLIVLHKSNILKNLIETLDVSESCLCIKKTINNKNISVDFKEKINKYQTPDIILFRKNDYINKKIDLKLNNSVKCIYTNQIKYMFPKRIPKIAHFYWDNSKFDYLTSLSIQTFVFNNPEWEINLWVPNIKHINDQIWEKHEFIPPHTMKYNDNNYLDYNLLYKIGVNVRNIDYFNMGLKKNYSEVLKSDIFRWKVLHEIGGCWLDMDILFTSKIERVDFEKYDCKFDEIELVVSQYRKYITDVPEPIDFYYIGFLMSCKDHVFFKTMYKESIKHINENSYQGVGGDLMKSHFGLFDDIKNKIRSNKYANLQPDSVYHYWWGDLKNLFINESHKDIIDYNMIHNNIIGYHWFRGVHLSKIYTNFYNYDKKIHCYDMFNGPLDKWVTYYKGIFSNFKIIKEQKKISIVMGYINRIKQLEITLQTIFHSQHNNFEIIIVNDGTEDLSYLKNMFDSSKIIIIDNHMKEYINPCMSYNIGIKKSTGDIIILQNPECCHIGDIMTITNCLLKENDYLAFSSFYLDSYKKNKVLYDILFEKKQYSWENVLIENVNNNNKFWTRKKVKDMLMFTLDYKKDSVLPPEKKGWCSHHFYNNNYLHFCTAIYKNKLENIRYFSEEYKDGICFDDDDLVRKIILNKLNKNYFHIPNAPESYPALGEFAAFVVHQHHERFEYTDPNIMEKWNANKNIFIKNNYKYVKKYLELSKIMFDINILHGDILKYNQYNNYNIVMLNTDSKVILRGKYELETFKYIFNGGNLSLTNNLLELFNNMIYEVKIYVDCENNIICNNVKIKKENGVFIYNGKLIENKIIIENLPIHVTKFIFEYKIIDKNFKDNTIFKQITK